MSTPLDRLTELTRRSQETMDRAWDEWSSQAKELLGEIRERGGAAAEDPEQVLDAMFDFGEKLLEQQRGFVKDVLAASAQVRRSAAGAVAGSMGEAVDAAGSVGRSAADAASGAASAAREEFDRATSRS